MPYFFFLQAAARKPNFVYVMVDDAGYGDFPASDKKFKTPSVDRMAKEGMKLTDFYSSSTVSPLPVQPDDGHAPDTPW